MLPLDLESDHLSGGVNARVCPPAAYDDHARLADLGQRQFYLALDRRLILGRLALKAVIVRPIVRECRSIPGQPVTRPISCSVRIGRR
jgi:hypothetical protein